MRFIGSKNNLLTHIENIIKRNVSGEEETFLDVFAGTNVVGSYFKKDYTIYSNDFLYFSYANAKAIIENNNKLSFDELKKNSITNPFEYLENIALSRTLKNPGYYEMSYTPSGDSQYLTVDNGRRIDTIRETIEDWQKKEWLTEYEYFYLVSSLIESIPFVSNTTGTYGAFLKKWDKRALKPLKLLPLEVINNQRNNKAFNEDSNELVKKITVDIAYIDPPYNTRQYASNYHLLENISKNNKPKITGKTSLFDWSHLKSDYATKKNAFKAMSDLIENIDATHVILSYNNEGIIPEKELISLMQEHAINSSFEIERIPYRKYKSKKVSTTYDLHEFLIYIQKKPTTKKRDKQLPNIKTKKWKVDTEKYIKSPLNYIGGKHRLLKQIIPLFPQKINTFVDLFSGGANVGINVKANYHVFNDMNYHINEIFRYFMNEDIETLVRKIKSRINENKLSKTNKQAYIEFRNKYNKNPNPLDLYILVAYSYNHQLRFNNSMEFNNPFGRNRSQFSDNMEMNLRNFMSRLKTLNALFTDKLFSDLDLTSLGKNDFVYLDPPYLITTGSYNDGNRGFVNWTKRQEEFMYKVMEQLTRQGVRYALSNVIEHKGKKNEHLKDFIVSSGVFVNYLNFNYGNSSYNTGRGGSKEILATNYDPLTFEITKFQNTISK